MHRWIAIFAAFVLSAGTAVSQTSGNLCTDGKLLCVDRGMRNLRVSAPLRIRAEISSKDPIEVRWELKDSAGTSLSAGSTYNDPEALIAQSKSRKELDVSIFLIQPAKSDRGTLSLIVSKTDVSTENMDLPALNVPVRLTTETTSLTILWPQDPAAYDAEVDAYADEVKAAGFAPKTPLAPKEVTVMKVDESARIAATAEALLHAMPAQGGPWRVKGLRLDRGIVHLQLVSDAWVGVSYYWTSIGYLLEKTLEKFPGVKEVEFK